MKNILKDDGYEDEEEIIPGLPTCIAFDILSRIPSATELSRFRRVSKTWYKSLVDPYFMSLHTSRSDQNHPFYCYAIIRRDLDRPHPRSKTQDEELVKEFDVTVDIQTADHEGRPVNKFSKKIKTHESPYLSLLTSHKQLICLSTSYCIYICNPSTQDFIELPKGSGLPFSLYNVGFGYLPSTMEYKVVRLFYTHYDINPSYHRLRYEVMTITNNTSHTNSYKWRVMEEACPYAVDEQGSVTINGLVIWAVEGAFRLSEKESENQYLLSFDLEREKLGTVPLPPCKLANRGGMFGIAELRGDLYFVNYGVGSLVMNMWMLKDWNTYKWLKQYNVMFPKSEAWFTRQPLDIIKLEDFDGNSEEVILVRWGGHLYFYHITSKTLDHLGYYSMDIMFCFYHDSFFSLPRPHQYQ